MIKHIDIRDLIAGVALVALGSLVVLYAASHYHIGDVASMGPGFFPVALGWILGGLGVLVVSFSFRENLHAFAPPTFALRPFVSVLFAIAAFSVLIERFGLIPTTVVMTIIAAFANSGFRFDRALVLGAVLAVLAWLIFSVGLQMTLPAFTIPG